MHGLIFLPWKQLLLVRVRLHACPFSGLSSVRTLGQQEYVFTLRIRQLLAHPDMHAVCEVLQNLTMVRARCVRACFPR